MIITCTTKAFILDTVTYNLWMLSTNVNMSYLLNNV